MLEEKDVQKIVEANRKIFATKDDLEVFAKKDDLKNFATKDDLKGFAKNDDLQKLTKIVDKLTDKVVAIDARLEKVEENMATKEDINRLRNSVDKYVKQNEDSEQEFSALSLKVNRHEGWIQKIAAKNKLKLEY
jgi:hypothetical protein